MPTSTELGSLVSQDDSENEQSDPMSTTPQLRTVSTEDDAIHVVSSEPPTQAAVEDTASVHHSDTQQKAQPRVPAAKLRSSGYVLLLVLLYSTLDIFAWVVLCILSKRPMSGTGTYGVNFDVDNAYGVAGAYVIHAFYTNNERWLQAAQVILSIVAVLTIPLTSTVCSKAAVAFVQQDTRRNLTLRQVMVLADRGWTDPLLCLKMLAGGLKRYGTKFLLGAMLMSALGGILAPLQSYFLTTKTIKTPTFPYSVNYLTDIADQFAPWSATGEPDYNRVAVMARSAMTSVDVTNLQSRLWTGDSVNCSQALKRADLKTPPLSCYYGSENTLSNLTVLPDPFLAQLPSGYSTGLIRQYLLRINSTAHREYVQRAEYPVGCETIPGAFFARYGGSTFERSLDVNGWGNWSLEACMPTDLSVSPWRATRSRQEFVEELYLNISLDTSASLTGFETKPLPLDKGGLFKITLGTTAGYFELPNYMNGQKPGKLLQDSPVDLCRGNCSRQASPRIPDLDAQLSSSAQLRRDGGSTSTTTNSSLALEQHSNRGPLATISLALFGTGSFIAERLSKPDGFVYPRPTVEEFTATRFGSVCVAQAPFMGLLRHYNMLGSSNRIEPCLKNDVYNRAAVNTQVLTFVNALYYSKYDGYDISDNSTITNAFNAAAFLTNQAWLLSTVYHPTWNVAYDMGADTLVPIISDTGIVVVSALLGVFLTALLLLAVYSALVPRWTDQLDAFAILRLGASLSDEVQLRIAHKPGDVTVLDTLPGAIGDATDGEGLVGELALGAWTSLTGKRVYAAYETKLH